MLCCVLLSLKLTFALVLFIRLFQGMATGILAAGLTLFVAALPNNTALLSYLHAFYGVGALVGPLIASTILALSWGWNTAILTWTFLALPLLIGLLALFRHQSSGAVHEGQTGEGENGLLAALKIPAVWFATLFLLFYVGVEVSLGSLGYNFLFVNRHAGVFL